MNINELIQRGADAAHVTVKELKSSSRKQHLVLTRHAITHIARRHGYTMERIAAAFNHRQTGTVINSINRADDYLICDKYFRELYNQINPL